MPRSRRVKSFARAGGFLAWILFASGLVGPATPAWASSPFIHFFPCRPWRTAQSPLIAGGFLNGASGSSATDVWAVGDVGGNNPIIEHWDGASWSGGPQDGLDGGLWAVDAASATDAWAAGYLYNGGDSKPLIEHWDGSTWKVVSTPAPGHYRTLYGVSAVSPLDVWAVGDSIGSDGTLQPLIEHWDGVGWKRIRQPKLSYGGNLLSVTAISGDNVWAVGYQGTEEIFEYQPLIERWNGTSWRVVQAPTPPGDSSTLDGVSALSPDDIWAVGSSGTSSDTTPLILHWGGSSWRIVPAPGVGSSSGLLAVSAISTTDVWTVGFSSDADLQAKPLTEHWDGAAWSIQRSPDPGSSGLADLAGIASDDIWTVGSWIDESQDRFPLILRSRGSCPT